MPRLAPVWHVDEGTHYLHARYRDDRVFALGAASEILVTQNGEIVWREHDPKHSIRSFAVGEEYVLCAARVGDRLRLLARSKTTGELQWEQVVEARRLGRVFAAGKRGKGRVFLAIHQAGKMALEVRHEATGELIETKKLDRRRMMVARNGSRLWTRDAEGVTELLLVTDERRQTHLGSNGFMVEIGDSIISVVGKRLVRLRAGELVWQTELPSRDLTALGIADGVAEEGEEEDIWPPELGRPVAFGDFVVVPDLNGYLHALRLQDGALQWSIESEHYPSSQRVGAPTVVDAHVVFPAPDETLYLANAQGDVLDRHELAAPFEGVAITAGRTVVLPGDGLRGFDVR